MPPMKTSAPSNYSEEPMTAEPDSVVARRPALFVVSATLLIAFSLLNSFSTGAEARVKNHEFLEQYAATYRFSLGRPANIEITRAGDAVLFLRSGPRSFVRDLYEFDVKTGQERVLATAEKLLAGSAEELSDEEKARRERMRLAARGIASFELSRDGRRVLVPLSGRLFVIERASLTVKELPSKCGPAVDARFSPDARCVACVRGGNLFVLKVETGEERQLTTAATETLTYGLAEFVAQEEMARMHGYWWAPDSQSIVYQETDTSDVETLYIADPAHPERPAQSWRYPRPGKNNARVRLGVIAATGGPTQWIDGDRQAFPYLAAVTWDKGAHLRDARAESRANARGSAGDRSGNRRHEGTTERNRRRVAEPRRRHAAMASRG